MAYNEADAYETSTLVYCAWRDGTSCGTEPMADPMCTSVLPYRLTLFVSEYEPGSYSLQLFAGRNFGITAAQPVMSFVADANSMYSQICSILAPANIIAVLNQKNDRLMAEMADVNELLQLVHADDRY